MAFQMQNLQRNPEFPSGNSCLGDLDDSYVNSIWKKNKTSRFLGDSLIGHLNVKDNPRSQWLNGLLVRKKRREFSGMMIHGSSLVINNHPISTPSNPSDPSSNPTFSTSKIVHGCFLGINHYYPWLTIINHHESPIRIINYRYIKSH